jgi:hypothetical protein
VTGDEISVTGLEICGTCGEERVSGDEFLGAGLADDGTGNEIWGEGNGDMLTLRSV